MMGDYQNCPVSCKLRNGLLNKSLVDRIDIACDLVQKQDWGVFQKGSRNRNPLLLSAGEPYTVFSDHGLIPIGKRQDKVVDAGLFCSFNDFFLCSCRLSQPDIPLYGIRKELDVLHDDADRA